MGNVKVTVKTPKKKAVKPKLSEDNGRGFSPTKIVTTVNKNK